MVWHRDTNVDNTHDMTTLTHNYASYTQYEMYSVPTPLLGVHQDLVSCGVRNRYNFDRKTATERISEKFFDDIFSLIMDISWKSVEDSLTYFQRMNVKNGRLKISPQKRHHIKELMQWDRIHLMMVMDHQAMTMFCMDQIQRLINQFNTSETFNKYFQINRTKSIPILSSIMSCGMNGIQV